MNTDEESLPARLRHHIEKLASEIGERNIDHYQNLIFTIDYLTQTLTSFGYSVTKHDYQIKGRFFYNVIAELKGELNEIVIVGAHYDSVLGSCGANDNASGVAAVIELAREFASKKPMKTLRFLFFVNEESPFFYTKNMGSFQYAKKLRKDNEKVSAMLSIETIGYYTNKEKSQKYPFPYQYFYPSQGNFIAFVANLSNRKFLKYCLSVFRHHSHFPSEGAAAPAFIPGVFWSDQWSFWYHGYPGVMVTDTALFRYPYYHSIEDTPDKLQYEPMAQVVTGLKWLIADLVKRT